MEAYTGFAQVYDTFMDDTPYEEWCDYLVGLLKKYRENTYGSSSAHSAALSVHAPCSSSACVHPNTCAHFSQSVCVRDDVGHKYRKSEDTPEEDISEPETGNNYRIETDDDVTKANLKQEQNSILDLGCGTGTLTELFARQGYDMIGIDNAQEMLQIAMDKRDRSGLDILYLLQDMREFELYGTVGAVISVCDSVNYLLEEEDVVRTFRLVNNYLYPKGIFIFDFNTAYKYEVIIGDTTIAENREECSFIWDNYYHEAERINEYDLTIFVQEDGKPGLYRRFQETHYQRGYELEQMKEFLRQAGLVFLEATDADTHEAVTKESQRIYVAARKGE